MPHHATHSRAAIPNVGAVDTELRNSPIVQETAEDAITLGQEASDQPVCYFNGSSFGNGALVRSGTQMLECRDGLWVDIGSADPKNP